MKIIKKITSINNAFIKEIYKDSRLNNGKAIILNFLKNINEYGELNFDYLLCTNNWYDQHKLQISKKFKNIVLVNKDIINKLSFIKTKSEVLGILSYQYQKAKNNNTCLVLEKISDPNNLASIIRSAVAFNICDIFLTKDSVNPYNEKVIRGTVGSFMYARISIIDNIEKLINELHIRKFNVIATAIDEDSSSIYNYQFNRQNKYAIIMGNEAKGISEIVQKNVKQKIYINMHHIESLNVASATAIMLYQLSKDLRCKK